MVPSHRIGDERRAWLSPRARPFRTCGYGVAMTSEDILLTETADLNPPVNWQLVTNPPVVVTNSTFSWAGPATNEMRFFRLILE